MNALKITLLKDITEMYYQSEFKIFEVNSDGSMVEPAFDKPLGYFISLGITTSFESLEKLCKIIKNSNYNLEAKVIELKSEKLENGSFLNTISSDEYHKFVSPCDLTLVIAPETVTSEGYTKFDGSVERFSDYPKSFKEAVFTSKERIQSITENSSDNYGILILNDHESATIFYKLVNYEKREDETEYRVGVYVTED